MNDKSIAERLKLRPYLAWFNFCFYVIGLEHRQTMEIAHSCPGDPLYIEATVLLRSWRRWRKDWHIVEPSQDRDHEH